MPLFVDIIGTTEQLLGLRSIDGILLDEHGQERQPDGSWIISTYVSSEAVVSQIRARGLTVEILQTAAQVRQERDDIAQELDDEDANS